MIGLLGFLTGGLWGCGEGAKLVQDTGTGGVVIYPFVPQRGSMTSSFRKDALKLIDERCRGHYHIVREGEAKGRDRISSVQGADEIVHDHRWGIQFECK